MDGFQPLVIQCKLAIRIKVFLSPLSIFFFQIISFFIPVSLMKYREEAPWRKDKRLGGVLTE